MDDSRESRIRDFLTVHRAEQFDFLAAIVRARSEAVSGEFADVTERLSAFAESRRLSLERIDVPEEDCRNHDRRSAVNLVLRHDFGPGPKVILAAHGDTAPVGDEWTHDPFGAEIKDGRMYGRGVASSKGDIAAYLFALLALIDAGAGLSGTLEIHVTFDGESGGDLGAGWLMETMGTKADYAIASGSTHALVTSACGYMRLEVSLKGRGAPASAPDTGADAIEAAGRILTALYDLRRPYNSITSNTPGIDHPILVVTGVSGGESPQTVAAGVNLQIERRLIPEEDPARVERDLTTVIGSCMSHAPGVRCKVRVTGLSPAMSPTAETEALVAAFQDEMERRTGSALPVLGIPGDTEGRHYAEAGIPTVLFGAGPKTPGDANVGGPDEFLDLDDLRTATEVVANVVANLLSLSVTQSSRTPERTES